MCVVLHTRRRPAKPSVAAEAGAGARAGPRAGAGAGGAGAPGGSERPLR